jgi:hypothetical protein
MNKDVIDVLNRIVVPSIPVMIAIIGGYFMLRQKGVEARAQTTIEQDKLHSAEIAAQQQIQGVLATKAADLESKNIDKLWDRVDRVEQRWSDDQKASRAEIAELKKEIAAANAREDTFILKIAEQTATIQLLSAAQAQSQADSTKRDAQYEQTVKQITAQYEQAIKQRDDYQAQFEAARLRITALELEVARLGGKQ